ncbi:MAG: hypothetical protein ABGW81_05600 [Paracoccaceae bacterium]
MSVPSTPRHWLELVLFVLAGFVSIGLPLIPMGLAANSIAFPDVMFALFAAWVIRRPASAPIILIAFLAVLGDALMMRPMGLWALVLFVGMEGLRFGERAFRDIPFVLEWLYVSILFALLLILQNLLLIVSFDAVYGLYSVIWHWVRTVVAYPLVVMVLHWVMRVRIGKKNISPNMLAYTL